MVSFTHGWAGNLCADHHRNLQIHHLVKPFPCCSCELASENANKGLEKGLVKTLPFFFVFTNVTLYSKLPVFLLLPQTRALSLVILFAKLRQRLPLSLLSASDEAAVVELLQGTQAVWSVSRLLRPPGQQGLSWHLGGSWVRQLLSGAVGQVNFYSSFINWLHRIVGNFITEQ